MVLLQILKRRDASSVVVAVLVALILMQAIQTIPAKWAGWLSGLKDNQYVSYSNGNTGWKGQYLYPIVYAILMLLVLEVLIRIYIWASDAMNK